MTEDRFRSGYVAIIGRPNAGKSTLLNSIIGEKISIVTPKPQTTRKKITGIRNTEESQIIFIDTPGIHKPQHKLGEFMEKEAMKALEHVDIILFLVEPQRPGYGEKFIINLFDHIRHMTKKTVVFLLINKIDTIKKQEILPVIDEYRKLYGFDEILPVSALNPEDVRLITERIVERLPVGPRYYPDDLITDQYERVLISEIVREKVMGATEDEVPHSVAVEVLKWEERKNGLLALAFNIYVEKESQKGIIIGKNGERLKAIGTAARADIESLLGRKVFMELWVKVMKDWRSDERALTELGFK
jgi:GTP-binding protein Era